MSRLLPVLLLSCAPLAALAQEPQVRRAEVATTPLAAAGPSRLSQSERRVIRMLDTMTVPQMQEMLEVYSRLGNSRMTDTLVQRILQKEPANTRAREIAGTPEGDSDVPDNPALIQAEDLMHRGQPEAAAQAYARIRKTGYAGKPFPWQEDLAFAWYEAGKLPEARAAFTELARTPGAPAASVTEARRMLRSMELDDLSRGNDPAAMLRTADSLLRRNPADPDGIALKARALSLRGEPRKAVDFLRARKAASSTPVFAHEDLLGDALYEARMFDDARSAYQTILTDARFTPEQQSDATQRLKDLERDRLIIAGEHALRTNHMDEALNVLDQLKMSAPGHPDVTNFEAAVLIRQRHYTRARDMLMNLRDASKRSGNFFDARPDLAWALVNTGDWEGAVEEFSEVEGDRRFDTATQYDAARMKRELMRRYRPTASLEFGASDEAEGQFLGAQSELSTGFLGDSRSLLTVRSSWDSVNLAESRILARKDMDRYQAEVAWQKVVGKGFFGEVSAGASKNNMIGGARFGRYEQPGIGWEVYFRGNDRAEDSLPLMALDGRQTAVGALLRRQFADRWSLDARLQYRWVDVGDHRLGQGWDFDLNAGWTILPQTATRPELTLNYLAEIQRFDRNSLPDRYAASVLRTADDAMTGAGLSSALIDERINRHGLTLTLAKQFSPRFSAYLYGGVSQEFENGDIEGRAGAGLEAFVGPATSLILGFDYATSGNTGNAGADVWSGVAGARVSF